MNALTTFVSARLDESEAAAGDGSAEAWRQLLADHEGAVHLTERWAALELAVRRLATRYADHPGFDPRWRAPAPRTAHAPSPARAARRPPVQAGRRTTGSGTLASR